MSTGTHLPAGQAGTGVTHVGHRAGFCGAPVTGLSSALPSVRVGTLEVFDLGLGDRALQTSQALMLLRKELCVSVRDIGTVALGAVKKIKGDWDEGKRFLLQPLWQVNCC